MIRSALLVKKCSVVARTLPVQVGFPPQDYPHCFQQGFDKAIVDGGGKVMIVDFNFPVDPKSLKSLKQLQDLHYSSYFFWHVDDHTWLIPLSVETLKDG